MSLLEKREEISYKDLFDIYYEIGFNHPDPKEGLFYSKEAYFLAKRENKIKDVGYSLNLISLNNRLLGNTEISYKSSFEALRVFEELNSKKLIAVTLLNVAETYVVDKQYLSSIEYFKKSSETYLSLQDHYRLSTVYVNLGETYRLLNHLDSAEIYFDKALTINDSIQDLVIEAYATGNLGMVHRSQGKFDQAEGELRKAVVMLTELGDPASVVIYRAEMGQIHLAKGEIEKGIVLIDSSYHEAKSYQLKEQIRDLSKMLMDAYQDQGAFDQAFFYQSEYHVYKDSLINVENVRAIEQTKSRYELDKKDTEIALQKAVVDRQQAAARLRIASLAQKESEVALQTALINQKNTEIDLQKSEIASRQAAIKQKDTDIALRDAELQKQTAQNRTIVLVSILLGIILLVIYIAYRSKLKSNRLLSYQNQIIEKQSKEKELLYQEMHHRVKNNLQLISSIMGLNAQESGNDLVSQELISGKSRMEAMTLIHQSLYGEQGDAQIHFKDYLEKLVANLRETYSAQLSELNLETEEVTLLADDSIPIGLIINECVCNAVKYGGSENVRIQVVFLRSGPGFELKVNDNGPGFIQTGKGGFGTKLLKTLTRQLNATMEVESSNHGSVFTFLIPELITIDEEIVQSI